MGLYNKVTTTKNEIIAIIIHTISIVSLLLVIYLTHKRNNLVTYFSYANIGQHLSKLFRLVIFNFTMTDSPLWGCYIHAITNFLTVGMESYIAMLFALRLWLMITKKNSFKVWLLERTTVLTYIFGFGCPIVLSLFSILPQIIQGKNFVIPPNAENCITGYRTNAWQIILSGPATTLPPFFLSSLFAANIVFVICTVSTNNIIKDINKFSAISYSSWIRMLWFGVFFGLVVVINIIGDIKNATAMYKFGTPEPGIKNISIPYYITASVGVGVLLIFGTTPEAKRKISSLLKKSISGITTSVYGKKSRSNSHSQNQTFNNKNSNFSSMNSMYNSSVTIKVDQYPFFLSINRNYDNSTFPMIKNSVKPKKPDDELEATYEFNKFMKSLNNEIRDDDDNDDNDDDYLFKSNMYQTKSNVYNNNIKFYNEINYSSSPQHKKNNYNIPARMMVPIRKISAERMHQQFQNKYNLNTSDNNDYYYNSRNDKTLVNKTKHQYSEVESDQGTYYQSTNISSYNSQTDNYINLNDDDNNDIYGNYIRDGTYSEEILYPAKVSLSRHIKH